MDEASPLVDVNTPLAILTVDDTSSESVKASGSQIPSASARSFSTHWAALASNSKPTTSIQSDANQVCVSPRSPLDEEFDDLFLPARPLDKYPRLRRDIDYLSYAKAVGTFTIFKGYPHKRALPTTPPKQKRSKNCDGTLG